MHLHSNISLCLAAASYNLASGSAQRWSLALSRWPGTVLTVGCCWVLKLQIPVGLMAHHTTAVCVYKLLKAAFLAVGVLTPFATRFLLVRGCTGSKTCILYCRGASVGLAI